MTKNDPYDPEKIRSNLYFSMCEAASLMSALEVILPMAKDYANQTQNRSWLNNYSIEMAEKTLKAFKDKHPEFNDEIQETNESGNELVDDGGQFGMGA